MSNAVVTGARGLIVIAAFIGTAAAGWPKPAVAGDTPTLAPPLPCPAAMSPAEARKKVSDVFEGIVVDRWSETLIDGDRWLTLRFYRFQVVRNWMKEDVSREKYLIHGWAEGSPYMPGSYPVFERGRRYLVFSIFHDSPAGSFASSCLPGAEGEDIPRLAAELGPPEVTFDETDRPDIPFWLPLARSAGNEARIIISLIDRAMRPAPAEGR